MGARKNVLDESLTDGEMVGSARTNAVIKTRPQMSSRKVMANDNWGVVESKIGGLRGTKDSQSFELLLRVHQMLTCGKHCRYILQNSAI